MSTEIAEQGAGTIETKREFAKSPTDFCKNWMSAIEMAGKEEQEWCNDAESTLKRYRKSRAGQFNILFANTQTTVPALYNSEPVPDVRRRFGDDDEVGQGVATALERGISIQAELYDFNSCMEAAVKDRQLQGRGVTRVRVVKGPNGSQRIECEPVIWDDFRRGPAKLWRDVPWVAFRHRYTRDELEELSPQHGKDVELDATMGEPRKGEDLPEMFKRAIVWEIWDKAEQAVYFIAESFKDGPLAVVEDGYKLRDFFCVPEPLYAVRTSDTLVPVCEFMIWKPLADEVDTLTARIGAIVKVMKWRGLYDGAFAGLVEKLEGLEDGQLAAADDAARSMQQGGIDKAVWMMPVADAAKLVESLYLAREQAKNQLYELTGVADILRGSTQASETATAQQIKAQWGSLRLQEAQAEVQRYARDLFRMMADLMAEVMEPAEIAAMTGIRLTPEQAKLLKGGDLRREFVIEIETDSTIRADLARAQENVAGFVTGFGTFIQSVGPAVEAGMMPPTIAVKLLSSFARNFKLGREAETALDEWQKELEQKAQQPPAPPPPDPKVEADKAKAAAAIEKTQLDAQRDQAKHGMEMEKMQGEAALAQQKHQMEQQKLGAQVQVEQVKAGLAQRQMQAEVQMSAAELEMQREGLANNAQAQQEGHRISMEALKAKQAAAKKPEARE
ncbi:MAG TPA: hypothetical protein VGE09_08485 [Pseudoxanthomonas sp.]